MTAGRAVARVGAAVGPLTAPGTPEADELEALTILVNAYEEETIPIDRDVDPISF